MYYYDPNERASRRWGAMAVATYVLLLALVFLLVRFDIGAIVPSGEGIVIDFGDAERAAGIADPEPARADASSSAGGARAVQPVEQPVEQPTDPDSPVEVPVEAPAAPVSRVETPRETPGSGAAQQSAPAPEPTVNRRALFPGRTEQSASPSQGADEGAGNAGSEAGAPDADPQGTGRSMTGISYDLSGRSVAGSLPKPRYAADRTGKVVIEVTVDGQGRVTSAAYRAEGSTTGNSLLVDAALEAACKARFSTSDNLLQGGTITYVFRME